MLRINQMEPWLDEAEQAEILATVQSTWITEAERTLQFEREYAAYVGAPFASAISSGTIALAAALMALDLEPGDEVLVPDFTMAGTPNAVLLAGGVPVFVDIDARTLTMDPHAAEAAITSRTRVVLPVHFNGRPADMAALGTLADRHGLIIVEDAAQALGSRLNGQHLGTFGALGCFSLATTKVITTGQGGMIVTANENLYDRIERLKDHGRRDRSADYHEQIGYNFKFTDLQAAIGLAQMQKLAYRVERKKEMFALYRQLLVDLPVDFVETDLQQTSPWFMDVYVDDPKSLGQFLREEGIGSRPVYPPLHTQPCYAHLRPSGSFPTTERLAQRGLFLPSSSFLTDDQIREVCDAIRAYATVRV